jgi:hypothetical protein
LWLSAATTSGVMAEGVAGMELSRGEDANG